MANTLTFDGTPEQQARVDLYGGLLGEIKVRMGAIEHIAMGKSGLPGGIAREACFLQLRMLCELTALGCLVAHGDIKEAKAIWSEWSAGTIIKKLERLHPTFYPRPITVIPQPDPEPNRIENIQNGSLTKDELIQLNGICGDALHRGTIQKLLAPSEPSTDFVDIKGWLDKIALLLAVHAIVTVDSEYALFAVLWNTQDGGRHAVNLSKRSG
jgi:hypothetical protein